MSGVLSHHMHGDLHVVGLQPGCPRCEDHAKHPLVSLDVAMLRRLADGIWLTDLERQAAERMGIGLIA